MAASRRTGSSLYARSHGFGSGKKQWNVSYVCRSFQEPHQTLEAGDKIILPEAAFREVSRMKLPFPLLLRVVNSRLKNRRTDSGRAAKPGRPGGKPAGRPGAKAAGKPAQADGGKPAAKAPPVTEMYCGVIEFSAPAGEVMMPKWMMRSLHIREGGKADFTSIVKLPRGEWCVFRPHQEAFVQVIHDLGPRIFMETAMRNYSALSKGGTIVIDHFGETFKLDVVDTKPADSISLYGDCDLEVDFLPAKDSAAAAAGPSGAGQVVSGAPVPEAIDNTPIAQNVLEAVKKAAAAAAAGSDIVVSGDGAVTIAAPPQAGAATRNQPPKAATQQPLRPVGNAQPRRASASKAAPAQGHGGSGGGARHQSRADRLHAAAASGARPSGGGNKDAPPPPRVTATESRARKHRVSPREEPKPVQRTVVGGTVQSMQNSAAVSTAAAAQAAAPTPPVAVVAAPEKVWGQGRSLADDSPAPAPDTKNSVSSISAVVSARSVAADAAEARRQRAAAAERRFKALAQAAPAEDSLAGSFTNQLTLDQR